MTRAPQLLLQPGGQTMLARCVVLADDPNVVRSESAAVAMMIEALVVVRMLHVLLPVTVVVMPVLGRNRRGEKHGEKSEDGGFHEGMSEQAQCHRQLDGRDRVVVRCKSVRDL